MASHISFVISGLLLVFITLAVQSIPIERTKQIIQSPSTSHRHAVKQQLLKTVDSLKPSSISTSTTTTSPTTTVSQSSLSTPTVTQEKSDHKKKRFIDDTQLDGLSESESDEADSYQLPYFKVDNKDKIDHTLHTKIQEIPATIHDNADKPVDVDDSKMFSDIQMTPSELTDILRRRRDVKLNDESNRRRKRALSPYEFYDTDSFYDPYGDLMERQQYVRPSRSFAPLYWYPSVYERNIRSARAPSSYESSEWPTFYSTTVDNDEIDESPVPIFDDDSEDENDYESNRYPILLQSPTNQFDNLQLQQQYNTDDLPVDEEDEQNLNDDDDDDADDEDEEEQYRLFYERESPYYTRYEPVETYF